jgi:hypothetical protein
MDLKRNRTPRAAAAFAALTAPGGNAPPARAPGLRPRRWVIALALSLAIHSGLLLLFWISSSGSVGAGRSPGIVDTRVAAAGPEVDFVITLPDEAPRPRTTVASRPTPAPATPPPVSIVPPIAPAARASSNARLTSREKDIPSNGPPGARNRSPDGLGGNGGNGGGPEGSSPDNSFFQIPVRGQRLVFVIDRSASMGLDGAFTAARRELLACLDRLAPEAWFQVIAYNRTAETLRVAGQSGLLLASTERIQQARRLIEALQAEGGTDHLAALKRALLLRPDAIFFLTDADDLTEAQVREVTRFNRGRTAISTVELSRSPLERAPHPLQLLATQNRGMYRGVDLTRNTLN